MYNEFKGKRILITGGTGSFGKKCVQILRECDCERIIIFSRDEVKQFEMQKELPDTLPMRYFLGDVRDRNRLMKAFTGVNIVIHAAAMKQVPACEYNPFEAVKTNILGAQNIIDAALERGVSKVIALSSDKAADPVNLYGATKLVMEKLFIASNVFGTQERGPHFALVRYGNVLNSRSSVALSFAEQKEQGCLKLTDRRMTRFWITLEQAVRFVLDRAIDMKGGEVFVPMLPSAPVNYLADIMANGCRIEEVGSRPGEKLHETLVSRHEVARTYKQENFYIILPETKFFDRDFSLEQSGVTIGLSYDSQTNVWQSSKKDFRSMLEWG